MPDSPFRKVSTMAPRSRPALLLGELSLLVEVLNLNQDDLAHRVRVIVRDQRK